MVLVKGGYVVDPASGFEGVADILTENGKILAIGPDIGPEEGMEGKKSGGWDSMRKEKSWPQGWWMFTCILEIRDLHIRKIFSAGRRRRPGGDLRRWF